MPHLIEVVQPWYTTTDGLVIATNVLLAVVSLAAVVVTVLSMRAESREDAKQQERLTDALSEALHREQTAAHNLEETEADK